MSSNTVTAFAAELNVPAKVLLAQLRQAGIELTSVDEPVTEHHKTKLLESLRRAHGADVGKKIVLTRKQPNKIKSSSTGNVKNEAGITDVALEALEPQTIIPPPRLTRWTQLSSIAIKNFKAIRSLTLPLSAVTVMVGPNGSGKSSVLQAIHWAARAASYIAPKSQNEVVDFERLDYSPSSEPLKTAHKSELSSDRSSPPTEVSFVHTADGNQGPATATVRIWAARNRGGISVTIEGGPAVTPFKQREEVITSYIPGLAGLSEKETILVQPLLRRQAAGGDAGGVLRNVLFNIASRRSGETDNVEATKRLYSLNELIQMVHPNVKLEVSFNDREDIHIQALYDDSVLAGVKRPLETAATGVLQVVQIFAYLILFRPKLLLIDEPDAHLHPDKQERLIEALEHAAEQFDVQVVLTTHSPHIVRAASPAVNLVWVKDGAASSQEDSSIRALLGWGGLDKRLLFFVEDEDDQAVRGILRQWPRLNRQVAVCRCFGIDNLPRSDMLRGLLNAGDIGVKALIHRDRDFLTPEEVAKWSERYNAVGAKTWVSAHVDVEGYFCQPEYLSALYQIELEMAQAWITQAVTPLMESAKKLFLEKRKVITRSALYEYGGSPDSLKLWDDVEKVPAKAVLGKKLHSALKGVIKQHGYDDKKLNRFEIPPQYEMAPELKGLLTSLIEGSTIALNPN